ncbi:MAG: oligosaccharide flippase family protein [Candidatus Nanoarchaeia archaeon]|nr:oligosaccharide flippase family protein [Candidatus Nanoarchaeia archaeon]MDD5358131.1 oligosaccharide flippase family protein [Candidatus Nanoarchaeia archaeon]MDD5589318.1 oligosaccharide flippase family protein [Candidatus Nanoarchaeia archaeon]
MEEKGLKKTSIKNSLWELISKIVEKIGGFIFTILLARFLLPEGFGAYSLAMTVSLIFISFMDYAIDGTLIRYVSDALGKNDNKLARGYFNFIFRKKIIFSLIASFLLLVLAYPLSMYIFKKPFLFPLLFILGFYILILAIENSYSSLFYIFKYTKGKAIKELVKQFFKILITIIVFLSVAKVYYIEGVLLGLTLTNILILIFVFFYVKKFAFFLFNKEEIEKSDKKKIMKFFYYLLIGGATGLIFSYVDILMLGVFLPEIKYIGLYSAAVAFTWGIAGLLSFNSVFLPIFTQIKENNLEHSLNSVLKYSCILTIPIAFGVAVLSKFILFLIYGEQYIGVSIVLSLMAFLIIETVNGSFIITIFAAKEQPKFTTKITIYSLFINIVLSFILIKSLLVFSPLWALVGAVTATLISRYFALIMLILMMKKKLNLKLILGDWIRPLVASIVMFSVLFLLNNYLIKEITLLMGISEIIMGILIYILVMLLIGGISKKDFQIFRGTLTRQ